MLNWELVYNDYTKNSKGEKEDTRWLRYEAEGIPYCVCVAVYATGMQMYSPRIKAGEGKMTLKNGTVRNVPNVYLFEDGSLGTVGNAQAHLDSVRITARDGDSETEFIQRVSGYLAAIDELVAQLEREGVPARPNDN